MGRSINPLNPEEGGLSIRHSSMLIGGRQEVCARVPVCAYVRPGAVVSAWICMHISAPVQLYRRGYACMCPRIIGKTKRLVFSSLHHRLPDFGNDPMLPGANQLEAQARFVLRFDSYQ